MIDDDLAGSTAPAAVLADLAGRLAQIDALTSEPDGRLSLPHNAKVRVGPIRAALHADNRGHAMSDKVQAALTEIEKTRDRYSQALRDRTQERQETAALVTAICRAAGWPDPDDGYEDGPPTGHLALAVLTTERDQLAGQVRAASDIGSAADLVAEMVRRADAADRRAAVAERAAAEASDYARLEAVAAERFRAILPGLRRIAAAGELSGRDVAWLINVVTAPDRVSTPSPPAGPATGWTATDVSNADTVRNLDVCPRRALGMTVAECDALAAWADAQGWTPNALWSTPEGRAAMKKDGQP